MGSALGAAKTAAIKIGCSVEEWMARRANGERWCSTCRAWWFVENMMPEPARAGGYSLTCRACYANMRAQCRDRRRSAHLPREMTPWS